MVGVAASIDARNESHVCTMIRRVGSFRADTVRTDTHLQHLPHLHNDISELANLLLEESVEKASMENTGLYRQTPFHILKEAGIDVMLVDAYHLKNVPGRKTGALDSVRSAKLTRAGLLTCSRVLSKDLKTSTSCRSPPGSASGPMEMT
jgi:transposase